MSEFGGTGWNLHDGGFGWGSLPKDIDAFYARYQGLTDTLLDNPHIFGYCYTQLTDIEQEQNGLYTYDRKPKFDVARLHKIQSRRAAYEKNPPLACPTSGSPRQSSSAVWNRTASAFSRRACSPCFGGVPPLSKLAG